MERCEHLREFLDLEVDVIRRHLDEHKWFRHIISENDGVKDFIESYGWLIREMYCTAICADRDICGWKDEMFKDKNPTIIVKHIS
jgi:hypothetical protein|tara:strand:+ start:237 stop:491 length:255 start_codon:yes stop_codon:yes gene_type:complete